MDNMPTTEKYSSAFLIVQSFITIAYVAGAIANIIALWILYRPKKSRNYKHNILMRYLSINDILAQFGMLILLKLKMHHTIPLRLQCILYVCLRAFGLGSGCVAFIMAVERWLALTKPFVYQKYVTTTVLKQSVCILWVFAAVLTYLPIFGIGLYYQDDKCGRYRDATETVDIIYAYIFLFFGSFFSCCIVFFNISVIFEIRKIGRPPSSLLRRCNVFHTSTNYCTREEVYFAKLMLAISFIFIFCWMPQMICIPVARYFSETAFYHEFSKLSDMLMCAYFALNPYVYVLHRYRNRHCCKLQRTANKRSSTISAQSAMERIPMNNRSQQT